MPGLPLGTQGMATGNAKTQTLLFFNMRYDNPRREDVAALVLASNADIVMLSEYSRGWEQAVSRIDAAYPYRFHCPEWRGFGGNLVFSRYPLNTANAFCGNYASLGLVDAEIDGRRIELGTVHLRWPWPASGPRQIDALEPELGELGPDALIAGDFNSVTWSHGVRRFARYGGLSVSSGIGGTWMHGWLPSRLAPWLGLAIDNVLSKGAVLIAATDTLDGTGSDHLPVLVRFSIEP